MPSKIVISLLFLSLLLSQTTFPVSSQTAAENSVMLGLATMLPDSDVVATIDSERILNVAAPSLLGADAQKIEHLKNLLRTVENQIGLDPYEIKQIAFGLKLPAEPNLNSKDIALNSEFTAIIRTANPNGKLLDTWSKRIDVIAAFKEEQSPSRRYIEDFREYRDFKFVMATPEKLTEATEKFTDALEKTREITAMLNALPKTTTDAKAVSAFRAQNKAVADTINKYLTLLKSDTDTKNFRQTSIKLLNRWNAVTVDDGQRAAKLAGILNESKNIHPAYKQKIEKAKKIETLITLLEPAAENEMSPTVVNLYDSISADIDATIAALKNLPATKIKRTNELNAATENLGILNENLEGKLLSLDVAPDADAELIAPNPGKPRSFYDTLKQAEREETVNGKRMIVVDFEKLDAPPPAEKPIEAEQKSAERPTSPPEQNIYVAMGFLDERTMVIGFEKTVRPFLMRDAGYKNLNAIEMLSSSKNSLMAFAVNSNVVRTLASTTAKPDDKKAGSDIFSQLTKDINIYGSINYDTGGGVTNDITMSLGFFREKMAESIMPEIKPGTATDDPNADNTFEIAGYQIGKNIFYDLFNSFKAVQASMTFKFEKKKIAALVRSAPKIIDRIKTGNSAPQKEMTKAAKSKPDKFESFQDLIMIPQFYIDLAGLLHSKS